MFRSFFSYIYKLKISLLIRVLIDFTIIIIKEKMSQTKEVKDYYAILGVNHNATQAEIEEAYNKLAVEHHPKKTQK